MNESIIIQIKTNNTKHYDEYEFMLVLCLVIEDAVMKGRISGILQQISRQHLEHTRIHIREPFTYHTCYVIQHNTEKHASTGRFIRMSMNVFK